MIFVISYIMFSVSNESLQIWSYIWCQFHVMPLQDKFKVRSLSHSNDEMMSALYLQVSIISQALIFVTRSRSWCFVERPGLLLVFAFVGAQLVRHYTPAFWPFLCLWILFSLHLNDLSWIWKRPKWTNLQKPLTGYAMFFMKNLIIICSSWWLNQTFASHRLQPL